ncbi:hypothetical protein RHSIM_Rhsim11G0050400 [Rhododendron simsii]|uniref:Uncharacterized protein n=1 Tax=Rhododendron simsii TaxID=118357 RepID=A0A834GAT7_RHOSS|nr:hypothetical protein RHSIM_Rhsim11G0050400 [Rhododendron simsii]
MARLCSEGYDPVLFIPFDVVCTPSDLPLGPSFHIQFSRFSPVLLLLSQTLVCPDPVMTFGENVSSVIREFGAGVGLLECIKIFEVTLMF